MSTYACAPQANACLTTKKSSKYSIFLSELIFLALSKYKSGSVFNSFSISTKKKCHHSWVCPSYSHAWSIPASYSTLKT